MVLALVVLGVDAGFLVLSVLALATVATGPPSEVWRIGPALLIVGAVGWLGAVVLVAVLQAVPGDLSVEQGLVLLLGSVLALGAAAWAARQDRERLAAWAAVVSLVLLAVWGLDLAGDLGESVRNGSYAVVDRQDDPVENDRRLAGELIGALADPDEVVSTCFGHVAYGALANPVNDICGSQTALNQVDPPPGEPVWFVGEAESSDRPPPATPDGFRAVAHLTTECERGHHGGWYTVHVRVGSDADRRAPTPGPVPVACLSA